MKRTISIRLEMSDEQSQKLLALREAFLDACNQIVPSVVEHRCWNRVALHRLVYKKIRSSSLLGSQMVCNALFSVCKAYKNRTISKEESVPTTCFHKNRSVHFDKRTYSIKKGNTLSLYTLGKRITVTMRMGIFQQQYFSQGIPKEAELVFRKGKWYFNLVLDLADLPPTDKTSIFAIDVGEN